tara:strand:- start:3376 stop:3561 length:186 start_codon:yes stop_codon:yes gene_type:complete
MKSKKQITKEDMEIIERKILDLNIKLINWKYDIYDKMFRTRNFLFGITVILIIGVAFAYII